MKRVSASITEKYSIHEDGWTETLAGLLFLIKQIEQLEKSGDSFNAIYLVRLIITSSSYLAEQVFHKSVSKYIDGTLKNLKGSSADQLEKRLLERWKDDNTLRKVGISRAMKEWPEVLTGKKLNRGEGALQALKLLTDKRNDIVHELNDLAQYPQPIEIAKSAIFTAVEACKKIEKLFFPDQEFSYNEWLKEYPVEFTNLFGLKTVCNI